MKQCYHCGVEFKVTFDDEDAVVQHCPSCGVHVEEVPMQQMELDFEEHE